MVSGMLSCSDPLTEPVVSSKTRGMTDKKMLKNIFINMAIAVAESIQKRTEIAKDILFYQIL